jgi:hypothetical protein
MEERIGPCRCGTTADEAESLSSSNNGVEFARQPQEEAWKVERMMSFRSAPHDPVMPVGDCLSAAREIEALCITTGIIPVASLRGQAGEEVCC